MSILNVEKIQPIGSGSTVSIVAGYLQSPSIKGSDANYTGVVTATTFVGNITGGATGDFSIVDKIVHAGDTNTALRFPAADTFSVETGGTPRLHITSNGSTIIGGDTPATAGQTQLTLRSNSQVGLSLLCGAIQNSSIYMGGLADGYSSGASGYSDGMIMYDNSNNHMQFDTAGGERLRIDSSGNTWNSGNVGIQTSNITRTSLVGAGASFIGAYVGDGYIGFNTQLSRSSGYFIPSHINALMAGPVTLNSTMTLDGTWVIV